MAITEAPSVWRSTIILRAGSTATRRLGQDSQLVYLLVSYALLECRERTDRGTKLFRVNVRVIHYRTGGRAFW